MNRLFDYFPQSIKERVVENMISRSKEAKKLTTVNSTPTDFAFPKVGKLPLETKKHILSAMNHFFSVKRVSDSDKDIAYKKILQKASTFEICTIVFCKQYKAYLENINSNESKK